jgi:hypothetical protein
MTDDVQGHSGAALRNKSEDVKELLLKGIQAVVALTTPANGRPTNEHLAAGSEADLTRECLLASQGRSVHGSGTAARHKPPCYFDQYCI